MKRLKSYWIQVILLMMNLKSKIINNNYGERGKIVFRGKNLKSVVVIIKIAIRERGVLQQEILRI